jgi:hypothetical protein
VWVVDGANSSVHVFDNTVMPPKQIKTIKVRDQPFWLTWSINGRWVYAASGDVIDAQSKQVIASLKDEMGRDVERTRGRRSALPGREAREERSTSSSRTGARHEWN